MTRRAMALDGELPKAVAPAQRPTAKLFASGTYGFLDVEIWQQLAARGFRLTITLDGVDVTTVCVRANDVDGWVDLQDVKGLQPVLDELTARGGSIGFERPSTVDIGIYRHRGLVRFVPGQSPTRFESPARHPTVVGR